jgi:O-antigen ligase
VSASTARATAEPSGLGTQLRQDLAVLRASPDLAALCTLLLLTVAFGRPFSKIGVGGLLFVTEVALAAVVVLALVRVGARDAWERIRAVVPLVPLGVLWLAGAIAAVRGLAGHGVESTARDAGLVEYSLLVPLVAVLLDTEAKTRLVLRFLVLAGTVAVAVYLPVLLFARHSGLGPGVNPSSAVGLYLALVALPVGALVAYRRPVPWPLVGVAAGAVLLMALGGAKGVLVALVAATITLAALAPRPVVTAVAGLATVGAAVGIALVFQAGEVGNPPPRELAEATTEVTGASFAAPTDEGGVDNAAWRLSYWKYELEETASNPVFGVGFGRPAAFTWRDLTYDTRTGEDDYSVSPPHNSFVNLLFRTGLVGLAALAALWATGIWRTLRAWWAGGDDRPWYAALLALVVFAGAIASLNVALEGPYMGIVIWTLVGLTLVVPRRLARSVSSA